MKSAPLKILVTGSGGFVGKTLLQHIKSYYPQAICPQPSQKLEMRDIESIDATMLEIQPDWVIHLAAQSFVPQSFIDPHETYQINFIGTLNLLQSLKNYGFRGRMLYVGSGDQYGLCDAADLPINENHPLKPRNPYAVSKVAAEMLCYQWSQTESLDIVMARPFNHIGPGQSHRFVVPGFARQVASIKLGLVPAVIETGNLHVSRDFTDVRDIVRAYTVLLEAGKAGEIYNVCSGQEIWIADILNAFIEMTGVTVDIVTNPKLIRANEQQRSCGSASKIYQHTGWLPAVTLAQSLHDILEDQLNGLAKAGLQ
jgi:GDP-4-dehydro-6-deoxy-D-mannose reductase